MTYLAIIGGSDAFFDAFTSIYHIGGNVFIAECFYNLDSDDLQEAVVVPRVVSTAM